jgi:hypothetical protein
MPTEATVMHFPLCKYARQIARSYKKALPEEIEQDRVLSD